MPIQPIFMPAKANIFEKNRSASKRAVLHSPLNADRQGMKKKGTNTSFDNDRQLVMRASSAIEFNFVGRCTMPVGYGGNHDDRAGLVRDRLF